MTEVAHKKRGKCCGCGCRHCPFNHANVPSTERAARIQQPAWLHKTSIEAEEVDVLFWSGGKDSYLALRSLLKEKGEARRGVVLMTTFDARTRIIAHQEVEIKTVVRQAETLGVSLVGAPLHPGRKYEEQLEQALRVAQKGLAGILITRVCFGDLHLEHIRSWREQQLTPVVREVCGPVSSASLSHLAQKLRGLEGIYSPAQKRGPSMLPPLHNIQYAFTLAREKPFCQTPEPNILNLKA